MLSTSFYIVLSLAVISLAHTPSPIKNFTQLLYHEDNYTATFSQQYQLDTTYFKPGGPILFIQGHEDSQPISAEKLYENDFADYVAEIGAIIATLEHRYFGYSFPAGFDGSVSSYDALTLENVMLDSVEFVQYIKSAVTGAQNSPVIVAGGSYAGFLVTMLRLNYPDVFHGALASSPILREWGNPDSDPLKYAYYEWLSNVYYDLSAGASRKIKAAMLVFHDCMIKGDCATAIPDFGFCNPQPNDTEFETLYHLTLFNYRYAAQYDLSFPGIFPQPYPLQTIINATLDANTTGAVLRVTHQMMSNLSISTGECTPWSNTSFIDKELSIVGQAMTYIGCTYFPKLQDWVPKGNLFPAQAGSGCLVPEYESKVSNNSNNWWVTELGLTDQVLDSTERLLIVHGSYDGTTSWGSPRLSLSSDRNKSRVIIVEGLSHTEDTYSTEVIARGVKNQLDLIRETKKQYVLEWTGKA